jgi:uncharacterized integral membrane protein
MAHKLDLSAPGKEPPTAADQYVLQECAQLRDEIWERVRDQRSTEKYVLIACAVIYSFLSLPRGGWLSDEIVMLKACAWYVPPVLSFLAAARWCESVRLIHRIADYTQAPEAEVLGPRGGWETYLKSTNNGRRLSVLLSGYYVLFWLFLIFSTMTMAAAQHAVFLTAWRLPAALLAGLLAAIAAFALIARPWMAACSVKIAMAWRGGLQGRSAAAPHSRWRARQDSNL